MVSSGAPNTIEDAAKGLDARVTCDTEQESSEGEGEKHMPDNERIHFRTMTHSAIGKDNHPLPRTNLFAAKSRSDWIFDQRKGGYAALLYANMSTLDEEPGYSRRWWIYNQENVKRLLVKTPIENVQSAGIFTSSKGFYEESLVSSVMFTVAELVGSGEGEKYCISTPQLFLSSSGGFSQEFRVDNGVPEKSYRCFWYLSPSETGMISEYPELTGPDPDAVFI